MRHSRAYRKTKANKGSIKQYSSYIDNLINYFQKLFGYTLSKKERRQLMGQIKDEIAKNKKSKGTRKRRFF
jgi:hypothetical protein